MVKFLDLGHVGGYFCIIARDGVGGCGQEA